MRKKLGTLRDLEMNNKVWLLSPQGEGVPEGDVVSQEPVRAAIWKTGCQLGAVAIEG